MASTTKRQQGEAAGSAWQDMHHDVLLRILESLTLKERVRDVVLVCKHWSALCLAHPPRVSELEIQLRPISPGAAATHLPWLSSLGGSVRSVHLDLSLDLPRTLVSNTLACLAVSHPHLQSLTIQFPDFQFNPPPLEEYPGGRDSLKRDGSDFESMAGTFPLLKQLERLTLLDVNFLPWKFREFGDEDNCPADEEDHAVQGYFKGMNLRELSICRGKAYHYDFNNSYHLRALGEALTALTKLTKLHLEYDFWDLFDGWDWFQEEEETDTDGITNSIATMTSLRSVSLISGNVLDISPEWEDMQNLTCLTLSASIMDCYSLAFLPAICDLDVEFKMFRFPRYENDESPPLQLLVPGSMTGLTRLAIKSNGDLFQEDLELLIPDEPVREIQDLVSFQLSLGHVMSLSGLGSGTFLDLELLQAMPHLTFLSLSNNRIPCLPPAVRSLHCLQILQVEKNARLQLSEECLKTIESLLHLSKMVIDRDVWSAAKLDDVLSARIDSISSSLEIELFDL